MGRLLALGLLTAFLLRACVSFIFLGGLALRGQQTQPLGSNCLSSIVAMEGRGDTCTKKGKRMRHSFGNIRPSKKIQRKRKKSQGTSVLEEE